MDKRLQDVLQVVRKEFGEQSVMMGNELPPLTVYSVGIPMLDLDWGGGLAMGRYNIIAGQPGSGKTSIAMKAAARFQKDGFSVIWIDLERAFDAKRAAVFGLNCEDILFLRSTRTNELTGETLRKQMQTIMRELNKQVDNRAVFILDSLAANVTEKMMDDDANAQFGGDAKINNQMIRNLNVLLDENQCFIIINELRQSMKQMGDPNYAPGGEAQKYFASVNTWTRGGEPMKDGDKVIGEIFKWTVKKSRTSNPKAIGSVKFYYETGFDTEEGLVECALELGIIAKGGAGWYDLPGGERVRGLAQFVSQLRENEKFMADLQMKVYAAMPYPQYEYTESVVEEDE